MVNRMLILGLDSMPPKILYNLKTLEELMPYTASLLRESARMIMRSCHPPITVPAWMVMFTGKTPGELGIYGFRHRKPGSFEAYIVNSNYIKEETIWDWAGKHGMKSLVFGVPPTYPPKPINGVLITDFTTPGPEKPYTWPPWIKRELQKSVGDVIFDIVYRSHDKNKVRRDLFEMINNHLKVMEYLILRRKWDLIVYVEIGVDRAHHAFLKYFDKDHPKYTYHEVYSGVIPQVYRVIDEWLYRIHTKYLRDYIIVLLSDHGIKPMKGAFTINEWLIKEGFLALKSNVDKPGIDLHEEIIDWERTIAWAWGGYYSRVFINLKGREKHGIVSREEYEDVIRDLKKLIQGIQGPLGESWKNIVVKPTEVYPVVKGDPPDLMVYLDDLYWRPAGTIGWGKLYLPENDRGPDDAVHDWYGVFAVYDPEQRVERITDRVVEAPEVRKILEKLIQGDY